MQYGNSKSLWDSEICLPKVKQRFKKQENFATKKRALNYYVISVPLYGM